MTELQSLEGVIGDNALDEYFSSHEPMYTFSVPAYRSEIGYHEESITTFTCMQDSQGRIDSIVMRKRTQTQITPRPIDGDPVSYDREDLCLVKLDEPIPFLFTPEQRYGAGAVKLWHDTLRYSRESMKYITDYLSRQGRGKLKPAKYAFARELTLIGHITSVDDRSAESYPDCVFLESPCKTIVCDRTYTGDTELREMTAEEFDSEHLKIRRYSLEGLDSLFGFGKDDRTVMPVAKKHFRSKKERDEGKLFVVKVDYKLVDGRGVPVPARV